MKYLWLVLVITAVVCFVPYTVEYNMATFQNLSPVSSATLQTGEKVLIYTPPWLLPHLKVKQTIHTYRKVSLLCNYMTHIDINDHIKHWPNGERPEQP